MIDNELLAKFNRIQNLPVSEEMLGAYLENNLHGSDSREINNLTHDDSVISDLISVVENDIDIMNDLNYSFEHGIESIIEGDDLLGNFSLPDIATYEAELLIDIPSPLTEHIVFGSDCHNFVGEDDHILHSSKNDDGHHDRHLNHHPDLDFGVTDNNY